MGWREQGGGFSAGCCNETYAKELLRAEYTLHIPLLIGEAVWAVCWLIWRDNFALKTYYRQYSKNKKKQPKLC